MNSGPVHINTFSPDIEYDYIIVGAGSAGCVLANRLTEDPNVTVLLLEAGPVDTEAEMQVPLAWVKLIGTEVDWYYQTVPQKQFLVLFSFKDQQPYLAKGQSVGW